MTSRNLLEGILKLSLILLRFSSGEPDGDRETVTAGLPEPAGDETGAPERRGRDIARDTGFGFEALTWVLVEV